MRRGLACIRQERKRKENVKVRVNAMNAFKATTWFSAQKMLIPTQASKDRKKTKGGETWSEIFFIPPSNQMIISVITGNRKDIILYEYIPAMAVIKAKEKRTTLSCEYTLINIIYTSIYTKFTNNSFEK